MQSQYDSFKTEYDELTLSEQGLHRRLIFSSLLLGNSRAL